MLPLEVKKRGVKNLLSFFTPLAYYVLVAFEGGDPVAEAKARGDLEEVGRYVATAVRHLEREVVADALRELGRDQAFLERIYRELTSQVVGDRAEVWDSVAYFAKYLYWEFSAASEFSRCMAKEELEALCHLAGVEPAELRRLGLVYERWDSVAERWEVCSPAWLEEPLRRVAAHIKGELSREAVELLHNYVKRLFDNPRGYLVFRHAVFKDIPVMPPEAALGQVVPLPGVFDGQRVNPALREEAKRAIFAVESGRAPGGVLDEELGVYVDGGVVYAPVPEAVGLKVLAKYSGKRIVAVARWPSDVERYGPYFKPYGVELIVL